MVHLMIMLSIIILTYIFLLCFSLPLSIIILTYMFLLCFSLPLSIIILMYIFVLCFSLPLSIIILMYIFLLCFRTKLHYRCCIRVIKKREIINKGNAFGFFVTQHPDVEWYPQVHFQPIFDIIRKPLAGFVKHGHCRDDDKNALLRKMTAQSEIGTCELDSILGFIAPFIGGCQYSMILNS